MMPHKSSLNSVGSFSLMWTLIVCYYCLLYGFTRLSVRYREIISTSQVDFTWLVYDDSWIQ